MKACSASLGIRKTQIKMRYHFTQSDREKLKNLKLSTDDSDVA